MKENFTLHVLILIAVVMSATAAYALMPQTITYQGYLRNSNGTPVNTAVNIAFKLYSSTSGVNPLWTSTPQSVTPVNGVYSAQIGPTSLSFDRQYWLGVTVGSDSEMRPLQSLASVPYSMRARVAESLPDGSLTGSMIAPGSITPDKLAATCTAGEVLIISGAGWTCGALCAQGDFINCFSGPAGARDVGVCRAGIRTCLETGGGFGSCVGAILPSAEVCDGKDNDCNGIADDNAADAPAWHRDADGDGFGDPLISITSCTTPSGYIANGLDCSDSLTSIHPAKVNDPLLGGVEICDGIDNDCDGQVDNNCMNAACSAQDIHNINTCVMTSGQEILALISCYHGSTSSACASATDAVGMCMQANCQSGGFSVNNACIQQHCSGQLHAAWGPFPPECSDGQTRACGSIIGECRQGTQACVNGHWDQACTGGVGPVAEICGDSLDNNCDGLVDENMQLWAPDADNDGYGSSDQHLFISACTQPAGFVAAFGLVDCDDHNPAITVPVAWWFDSDFDGYGDQYNSILACAQPQGYVAAGGAPDCDDKDSFVHPGAPEFCNGRDDNCNGSTDEGNPGGGASCSTGLLGVCSAGTTFCLAGTSTCMQNQPAQAEICNGLDDNCNGQVDEGNPGGGSACSTGLLGICSAGTLACQSGALSCQQNQTAQAEICNGMDDNCNGQVDEGGVCISACSDLVKNGSETDVDCGGGTCTACAVGKACIIGADCSNGTCTGGFCTATISCSDGIKNGNETDVDCGGSCAACVDGMICGIASDCASAVCAAGHCAAVTCTDNIKNGNETDVDCGGSCTACTSGLHCAVNSDCQTYACSGTVCVYPQSCKMVKQANPAAPDGVYTIDPDGAGGTSPFPAYCDMTRDGGGWTLWASMTQTGTQTGSPIMPSANNYMDQTRYAALRAVSTDFKARGQSSGMSFYMSGSEAQAGNCHNLSSSAPQNANPVDTTVFGHKELSGCDTAGGDAAFLSIEAGLLRVVSTGTVVLWHYLSPGGTVQNLNISSPEPKVELYVR